MSRRRFATGTASGTIGRAFLTSPRSSAKLPVWPIGRRKIYGLPGRQLHRTGPPLGLSRDLLIRALAHQLQEQSYGGASLIGIGLGEWRLYEWGRDNGKAEFAKPAGPSS